MKKIVSLILIMSLLLTLGESMIAPRLAQADTHSCSECAEGCGESSSGVPSDPDSCASYDWTRCVQEGGVALLSCVAGIASGNLALLLICALLSYDVTRCCL